MKYALLAVTLFFSLGGCDKPSSPIRPSNQIDTLYAEWAEVVVIRDDERRVTCYVAGAAISCLRDATTGAK